MITLKNGSTVLTAYAWDKTVQSVNRVVSVALDGTQYYQVIGNPYNSIEIEGVCTDAEKLLIEQSEGNGEQIDCYIGSTITQRGYITELSFENRTYSGKMKFHMTLMKVVTA